MVDHVGMNEAAGPEASDDKDERPPWTAPRVLTITLPETAATNLGPVSESPNSLS
jgi:hypothetical protein